MALITFRSDAWANITMFGDVALTLLKMMGHSGTVPSALLAGDIPSALANLRKGLEQAGPETAAAPDEDAPPPVSLRLRAYPLIQLLEASAKKGCDVMWATGHPAI